jgi:hypothetical protein
VILHLKVSFLQFRSQSQILRPTAAATGGIPQVLGAVSGMSRLSAGTPWLATFTEVHRDHAGTKVPEGLYLVAQTASSLLHLLEGILHKASFF